MDRHLAMVNAENFRKKAARLLGLAPFHVETVFTPEGIEVLVDGKPPSPEQEKILRDHVAASHYHWQTN